MLGKPQIYTLLYIDNPTLTLCHITLTYIYNKIKRSCLVYRMASGTRHRASGQTHLHLSILLCQQLLFRLSSVLVPRPTSFFLGRGLLSSSIGMYGIFNKPIPFSTGKAIVHYREDETRYINIDKEPQTKQCTVNRNIESKDSKPVTNAHSAHHTLTSPLPNALPWPLLFHPSFRSTTKLPRFIGFAAEPCNIS